MTTVEPTNDNAAPAAIAGPLLAIWLLAIVTLTVAAGESAAPSFTLNVNESAP